MKLLTPRQWPLRIRLGLIIGAAGIALIAPIFIPRIPLGSGYHSFADTRIILGLPHALDVLSNVPFLIVGAWGVLWLLGKSSASSFVDQTERIPYLVFFAGVALTGIGSYYYHLSPSNSRLPWDLLPMTCCFVSIVAAQFMERVNLKLGLILLAPLLLLGAAAVAAWYFAEIQGRGDYKFYLLLQFSSPALVALIVILYPPRYSGMPGLAAAFALFVAAKLFEAFDGQIYSLGKTVSGHSLKHVTAALSCFLILRTLQVRHVIAGARVGVIQTPRAVRIDAGVHSRRTRL